MSALNEPSTIGPWSNQGPLRLRRGIPPAAKPIDHYERWTNVAIGALIAVDAWLIGFVALTLLEMVRR